MIEVEGSVTGGRNYRDIPLWSGVTEEEWNDWRWQLRNRVSTVEELEQVVPLAPDKKEEVEDSLQNLRMAITPSRLLEMS